MTAKKPAKKPAPRKVIVVIPKCLLDDITDIRAVLHQYNGRFQQLQNSIDALHRLRVQQDQRMMEQSKLIDLLRSRADQHSAYAHTMVKLHLLLVQRFSAALDTRYPLTQYLAWREQQKNPTKIPTLPSGSRSLV